MKWFVSGSIYFLIVTGVALLVLPVNWFPVYYDVRYMGGSMLGWVIGIKVLPTFFEASVIFPHAALYNQAASLFQFLLAFALMGDALGSLGFYELYTIGIPYDKVLHFFTPLLSVIVLSFILHVRLKMKWYQAALFAFFLLVVCGVDWEFFEYLADQWFHTHLLGVFSSNIYSDTKFDLVFDLIGSASGALLATPVGRWLVVRR